MEKAPSTQNTSSRIADTVGLRGQHGVRPRLGFVERELRRAAREQEDATERGQALPAALSCRAECPAYLAQRRASRRETAFSLALSMRVSYTVMNLSPSLWVVIGDLASRCSNIEGPFLVSSILCM